MHNWQIGVSLCPKLCFVNGCTAFQLIFWKLPPSGEILNYKFGLPIAKDT